MQHTPGTEHKQAAEQKIRPQRGYGDPSGTGFFARLEFEVSSPHSHVVLHPSSEEMGKGNFQDVKSESQYTFASL